MLAGDVLDAPDDLQRPLRLQFVEDELEDRCRPLDPVRAVIPLLADAASTRRRVSGDTSARPLITFETVGTETPAWAATRAIVGRSAGRRFEPVLTVVMAAVYRKFRRAVRIEIRCSRADRKALDGTAAGA